MPRPQLPRCQRCTGQCFENEDHDLVCLQCGRPCVPPPPGLPYVRARDRWERTQRPRRGRLVRGMESDIG